MRTRSNPVVTTCVSRSRENDTMSLERLRMLCWSVWSAVCPCSLDLHIDPAGVEPALQACQAVVGLVDVLRDVALEAADLGADRVGQHDAETAHEREHADVQDEDRQPARHARCWTSILTSGLRISATVLAASKISSTRARRPRQGPQGEQGQRQHDQLDPARNDHRRHRHRGAASNGATLPVRVVSFRDGIVDDVVGIGRAGNLLHLVRARRGRCPTAWETSKPCTWKYERPARHE